MAPQSSSSTSKREWDGSASQAPPLPPGMDHEQRRGRAILEILETEQSYQRLLGDFIGFFLRDLESGEHEQARAFMSLPNLAALCSNMEQIFHVSHQLCAELKHSFEQVLVVPGVGEVDPKQTRRWSRVCVGPIFCRMSSLLALYEQYVENHGFGKFDLEGFSTNKQFQQFWQKSGEELKLSMDTSSYRSRRGSVDSVAFRRHSMKPQMERLTSIGGGEPFPSPPTKLVVGLEGYLILPIQRIPRYALLLKEIEKLTEKICMSDASKMRQMGLDRFYEGELEELHRAFGLVSRVAERMNSAMRRSEANTEMFALQHQFVNKVDLVQCDEGRLLVREGELVVLSTPSHHSTTTKKPRRLYFHLLSDRLLCSEVEGDGKFRCLFNLPLESLYVVEVEEEKALGFVVYEHFEHQLVFALQSDTRAGRLAWVEDLRQCINISAKCALPVESQQCPLCTRRKFISCWCKRCEVACCSDCSRRKRYLPETLGEDPGQRLCDLCRMEVDLTGNEDEPNRFRLVVTVHSLIAHVGAPPSQQSFFSLTPRDNARPETGQPPRLRGPSTIGHAACFSIPIGPMPEVEEEEKSRFWVLHCFSGTAEVGHVTLDVEQLVCSKEMFQSNRLGQRYFAVEGVERRGVGLSFELVLPPSLWRIGPALAWGEGEQRERDDEDLRSQTQASLLLKIPGVRAALPIEQRVQRFASTLPSSSSSSVGFNPTLLVHYEKMAKDRPSKLSLLSVKYLYVGIAKVALGSEATILGKGALEWIQERDVKFDKALERCLAKVDVEEEESKVQFLSHLSLRALEHFDQVGNVPTVATTTARVGGGTHRELVLSDLVSTEQTYVSSIKLLNEVFVTPLIHLSHGASVATVVQHIKLQRGAGRWLQSNLLLPPACPLQAEVIVLLQCLRQILSVNYHLLTELQRRRKDQQVMVGDTFKRFSVVLKVYIAYLTNHAEVERLLGGEGESPLQQFVRFLQEDVRCGAGNHSFVKLLRLPKERLTRYKRFLHGLLMHTAEDHPDAKPIRESLKLLEESEQQMSWSVRRRGNMEKLVEIQRSFLKILPLQQRVPQLVSARRWFIKEGDLVKRCRRDDRLFRFWLFNDLLVYGEKMGGQYRFCRMLELKGASLLDLKSGTEQRQGGGGVGDARFAFEIRSAAKSFICMLPSAVDYLPPQTLTPLSARASGGEGSGISSDIQRSSSAAAAVDWDEIKSAVKQEWMLELTRCIASESGGGGSEGAEGSEEKLDAPSTPSTVTSATMTAAAAAAPVMMLYENILSCTVCDNKFSLTLRRHHCRRCGAVVCHFCSKARVVLGNLHVEKLQRVCVNCAREIQPSLPTTSGGSRGRRDSEIV
ncbi:hypothetical protein BASA81_008404 [Batrachochytrium salamandrivorans]|nr:hypothetical protein BASA81_008404 [Batrachochytrium salamandrivorans]